MLVLRGMMKGHMITTVLGMILTCVHADMYLHNPRGSNNRLNEKSAARKNANRLFDSQNNNRGGYNVGDATDKAAGDNPELQYQMHYFQSGPSVNKETGERGSQLVVEWTDQHGCGGNEDTDPQKQNCNIVLQMMCQDMESDIKPEEKLRDGVEVTRSDYTSPESITEETEQQYKDRKTGDQDVKQGMQEPWEWYDNCYVRERNNGLFAADQKIGKNKFGYKSATHTRQDRNGNQYGYECPEERDYFPYWHPTPWKDIAVLAENSSMCSHYTSKSFNVQPYHECIELWPSGSRKPYSRWNNAVECEDNGGKWTLLHSFLEKVPGINNKRSCVQTQSYTDMIHTWGVPYDSTDGQTPECLISLREPECYQAPWSRSNHLGNGRGDGIPSTYKWTLPYFPSGNQQRCVFRARYNVTTDDYDPYHTNASYNGNKSPVQNNKQIEVAPGKKLQMALNTDQTGRIFQDRSHVFILMPRPAGLERFQIYNLNVRGKRGNIVQTYPAVEYDFTPNHLHITPNDLVHIQWTGSNTHNNGPNAGDGQAGDEGEGTDGTDRLNMAEIADLNENFPLPFEQTTMWKNAEIMWIEHGKVVSPKDLALGFASSGYYRCFKETSCPEPKHSKYIVETQQTKLNSQLNNAPASYKGAVLKFKRRTYHYMCTRNNNYTNRSNKGTIHVV